MDSHVHLCAEVLRIFPKNAAGRAATLAFCTILLVLNWTLVVIYLKRSGKKKLKWLGYL
jgi:hypothetical protein